ncbi:MAG TPA: hypothetical protein VHH11_11240 [Gammaproteobacteria bacterium]|jgi:hypothetical protein|nr:hypothetical protein [Gammaproteobacteria bacterium]
MRKVAATLCAVGGLWFARTVHAQDTKTPPPSPDLDFLEYLGAWQDNDDEWLISEQWEKDRAGADRRRAADTADGKKPGQARNDDEGE